MLERINNLTPLLHVTFTFSVVNQLGPKLLDLDLMNGIAVEEGDSELSLKVDLQHFGQVGIVVIHPLTTLSLKIITLHWKTSNRAFTQARCFGMRSICLCGLHKVCSHIMTREQIYLFVHESRWPVTWSSKPHMSTLRTYCLTHQQCSHR